MNFSWLCFFLLILSCGWGLADPVVMWEDFEDAGGAPAFDSAFLHSIGSHPDAPGSLEWTLTDLYSPTDCLWLYPALDYITLDLESGLYIEHASVDLSDRGGDTTVEFIGGIGTLTFEHDVGSWQTYEADFADIGAIEGVRLYSYDGLFDDVVFTVVPEPGTWALFVCGAVLMWGRFGILQVGNPDWGYIGKETKGTKKG